MSADNGIYILVTPRGKSYEYRVKHLQGVDQYMLDARGNESNDSKVLIANARRMWNDCVVYTDNDAAMKEVVRLAKETSYTEYGIGIIEINHEF